MEGGSPIEGKTKLKKAVGATMHNASVKSVVTALLAGVEHAWLRASPGGSTLQDRLRQPLKRGLADDRVDS